MNTDAGADAIMALRSKTPCRQAGCPALVDSPGYCDAHRRAKYQEQNAARDPVITRMYKSKAWRELRAGWLRVNPVCEQHMKQLGEYVTKGLEVDHITPHNGDWGLFLSSNNLQTLCASCHSKKTAREDGGFGHAKR